MLSRKRRGCLSGLHLDAFPERDVTGDLLRRVARGRIVPGRVLVYLPADVDVVVARRALPRADRVRLARLEELFADRVGRKIVIALDDDRLVRLGEDGVVPGRA